MRLLVDHDKSANSVVFIRWCLSPKEIKRLANESAKDSDYEPHILICVIAVKNEGKDNLDYREESRKLLPLKEMATYLTMRNAGRHLVYAFVARSKDELADYRQIEVRRDGYNTYRQEIFDFYYMADGRIEKAHQLKYLDCLAMDSIQVYADEQSFEKKPWDWNIINSWYECKPIDQCKFRGRRWVTWPFLTVWAPIREVLLLFLAAFWLFIGIRRLNWQAFSLANGCKFTSVFPIDPTNRFFSNSKGDFRIWRAAFWPPVIAAICAIVVARDLPLLNALVLWLVSFEIIVATIGLAIDYFASRAPSEKALAEMRAMQRELADNRRKKELQEQLQPLSSQLLPDDISFATVPSERRTIYLRFLDLKRKLCKPYSS